MKNMIFGSALLFIGTSAFSQSEIAYNDLRSSRPGTQIH